MDTIISFLFKAGKRSPCRVMLIGDFSIRRHFPTRSHEWGFGRLRQKMSSVQSGDELA